MSADGTRKLLARRSRLRTWAAMFAVYLSGLVAAACAARLVQLLFVTEDMTWEELAWLAIPIGVLLLPVALVGWFHARLRGDSTRPWTCSTLLLLASGATFAAAPFLDSPERAVRRAQPLVDAIHEYERTNGAPPARLEDLIPHSLPEIPSRFTRTFRTATYGLDEDRPLGWWLVITGSPKWTMSSEWLSYQPGTAEPISTEAAHLPHRPRRIGNWIWNEVTF